MRMKVSIVILTWNSVPEIEACLASLAEGVTLSHEVIVVDNGSQDQTCRLVQKTWPTVRLVRNPQNRGVAPARNQGIRLAGGEYIVILDDDTVVQPRALDRLVGYMDAQPEVGLCGPRLTTAEGDLQLSCRRFPTLVDKLARRLPSAAAQRMTRAAEMADWDHRTIRAVDYVIGACQVIRRRALHEVGLFDERIFYGPEDVDLCLRLQQAGWQVAYNPDAVVVHKERRVTRSLRSVLTWKHGLGLGYFFGSTATCCPAAGCTRDLPSPVSPHRRLESAGEKLHAQIPTLSTRAGAGRSGVRRRGVWGGLRPAFDPAPAVHGRFAAG